MTKPETHELDDIIYCMPPFEDLEITRFQLDQLFDRMLKAKTDLELLRYIKERQIKKTKRKPKTNVIKLEDFIKIIDNEKEKAHG